MTTPSSPTGSGDAPRGDISSAPRSVPNPDDISWRPILIGLAISAAGLLLAFGYLLARAARRQDGNGDLFWIVIAALPLLMMFGPTRRAVLNIVRRKAVILYLAGPLIGLAGWEHWVNAIPAPAALDALLPQGKD